jgi:hypothetical protein
MNPNPFLQYRHAVGIGDFIACTLHSKYLSPLTKAITGKDGLCASCDARRQAFNILFPIPFWKLFFKTSSEREENIEKFLTYKNDDGTEIPYKDFKETDINAEIEENDINIEEDDDQTLNIIKNIPSIENIKNNKFLNSSDVELDNYIVRTIVYKKI